MFASETYLGMPLRPATRAGVPIVLVHGLIGTLQHADILDHFPPGTLAPALLGYGPHARATDAPISIEMQVEHLRHCIEAAFGPVPVVLVGHSVGGIVAAEFAYRHPLRVARLVSVEGNFTLNDAFWSARVARMSLQETEDMLLDMRQDPVAWAAAGGLADAERFADIAQRLLDDQPAATLRAMARAVIEATGAPDYLQRLRQTMQDLPVHLLAGERSREGWDVPDWAVVSAASFIELRGVGHMMMLEDGAAFAEAVRGYTQ